MLIKKKGIAILELGVGEGYLTYSDTNYMLEMLIQALIQCSNAFCSRQMLQLPRSSRPRQILAQAWIELAVVGGQYSVERPADQVVDFKAGVPLRLVLR
jgi:hypothetical protein